MSDPLAALRRRFRSRAEAQALALGQALAAGDRHAIVQLAHQLSGSAALFGFGDLGRLARETEQAADDGLPDAQFRTGAELLRAELRRVAQEAED